MVALDHGASVVRKPGKDRQRGLAIELVGRIDIRHVLGAHRERRHNHVGIDIECLARRNLAVGLVYRRGRANFGQSGNLVHRLVGSCWIVEKSNFGSRWRKSAG
jgi:hypothetical protein